MDDFIPAAKDEGLLDNPIWHSLATDHAHLAMGARTGGGHALRYPADIGPLSGVREPTPEAYAELARLVPEGDVAVLFLEAKAEVLPGWQLLRDGTLVQMACPTVPDESALAELITPLRASDFADMMALAALTEPGPFRSRTGTLGGFLGIRVDGRLAAMSGRRLSPSGFSEVSAVCTHPDFRGRGYAKALVGAVTKTIHDEGRTPFLTSFKHNTGAIRVYQEVGFVVRREFELAVLKPPAMSL